MADPYRENGDAGLGTTEVGGYQILNPISQHSSSDSSYDYPTDPASSLLLVKEVEGGELEGTTEQLQVSAAAASNAPTMEATKKRSRQHMMQDNGEVAVSESLSSSEGDSSDPGTVTVVRQVSSSLLRSKQAAMEGEGDEKLYITGTLMENNPSVFFKTGIGIGCNDGFANEGIYQGLVMTDKQKKNIGILPESLYMTTNLLEKGALIESMSLLDTASAVAVEVPEVPLPPSSPPIFSRGVGDTMPKAPPPKPPRREKAERDVSGQTPIRSVAPHYRDLILRPPPLPPLSSGANRAERKAFAVVENLLKSEAAYLTSLNIAIKIYMTSLLDQAEGPSPILSVDEIETIFGPVTKIMEFQEIFYSAITSRTLDWTPLQKIGDVLSSLSTKDVVQNYSQYVNNFTMAMSTLEKAINKKPRFVQFLKEKYANSRTSLSLQGLLLKPVQRFPQYIMFLQDLIKYTCSSHPDRVTLQMALARYEGIANFLNESKRQQEQKAVVQNLAAKISHLPFKLTDGKRWLCRQDIVLRLLLSNGKVTGKDRCLLLFNNMVLCASMKKRKKKGFTSRIKSEELESSTGSRDFQSISKYIYSCKWYCPLEHLEISTPDYINDIWDQTHTTLDEEYIQLKAKYKKMEEDLEKVGGIARIAATLQEEYKGLSCEELSNHVRIIQRKIAEMKEELKLQQQGRLDITFPSRENDRKVHHTYAFQSEKCKLDWLNNLRYAKLKLNHPVNTSWVIAEDISRGDIFEVSYKLPLLVEKYSLNMINNELLSVQCAAKVGQIYAWLASGDNRSAQVSIVECVTPSPLILECFKVDSKRIIDIVFVPPSAFCLQSPPTFAAGDTMFISPTIRRNSRTIKGVGAGSLSSLPSYLPTVWMGSQCGRVIIYNADSSGDGPKQCLATIKLRDAVTSIQYYKDQVFVSTAEGNIIIFKRSVSGFQLTNFKTVKMAVDSSSNTAIRCTCMVGNKLWVGIGGSCYFLNMQTHKVEGSVQMNSREGVFVSKMVNQGEGVWVSYKGSSSLELFHTTSKTSLQNIDIKATLTSIIKRHKLETRLPHPTHVHVTAIMAASGYLWIGTSVGAIMVYHIPHLESVPIVSGKPYLAMDGHVGAIRVLLTVETLETYESSRLGKFLADEQYRTVQQEEMKAELEAGDSGSRDQEDATSTPLKRSASDPTLHMSNQAVELRESPHYTGRRRESVPAVPYRPDSALERSTTPLLQDPRNFMEESAIVEEEAEEEGEGKDGTLQYADRVERKTMEGEGREEEASEGEKGELEKGLLEAYEERGSGGEPEDDDYNSDELEAMRKFGGGVRGTGETDGGKDSRMELAGEQNGITGVDMDQSMDLSMKDSDDYTIPYMNFDKPGVLYGNITADRERLEEEEDPYSNPSELDAVTFGALKGSGGGGDGGYSVPSELDYAPRVAKKEEDYDFPAELMQRTNSDTSANPYEDPATLAKDPSTPLSNVFPTKSSLYVPGRPTVPKEGAIFVMTAGRGLINFRSGKAAASFNQANKDTEGCMIAYEIES